MTLLKPMENNITYPVVIGQNHLKLFYLLLFVGMLSKSKGQILRVATALHVLFHVGSYDSISGEITEEAIAASVNFVGLCCQQTAYMAGRGDINEDIQIIKASMFSVRESFWSMYVQLHIMYRHNRGD